LIQRGALLVSATLKSLLMIYLLSLS